LPFSPHGCCFFSLSPSDSSLHRVHLFFPSRTSFYSSPYKISPSFFSLFRCRSPCCLFFSIILDPFPPKFAMGRDTFFFSGDTLKYEDPLFFLAFLLYPLRILPSPSSRPYSDALSANVFLEQIFISEPLSFTPPLASPCAGYSLFHTFQIYPFLGPPPFLSLLFFLLKPPLKL